jgi:hypothetical protein
MLVDYLKPFLAVAHIVIGRERIPELRIGLLVLKGIKELIHAAHSLL